MIHYRHLPLSSTLETSTHKMQISCMGIDKVKVKVKATAIKNSRGTKNSGNSIQKPHMVIPYYKGISESIKKTCSKHGVQVYFKGGNTIKNLLAIKNSRGTKNSGNSIQKPHMVIPYYKGISESIKKTCSKHGVQVYFKGGNTIKNLLVAPKDQDTIQKKMESYIDKNATGWNAMRITLESPQEHLERGSKNISRHLPQYMTILTPLVTMSL